MRTYRGLIIVLLASLVLAACQRGETVTAEQIMERVRQVRETTRDARAVVEVKINGTDQDGRYVAETWLHKTGQTDAAGEPIAQARVRLLETTRDELAGSEMVNDGTAVWIWNPGRNSVITGKLADLKQGEVGAQDPTAQMLRIQEQIQQLLDGSNVEILADNEPVDGLNAWKVKLTPKPETAEQMQIGSLIETTVWIEQARSIPLKAVISAGEIGTVEITASQVELDNPADPALFAFSPPEGAEVVDAAELAREARPATTTLEDARAAAPFTLLTPDPLPANVVLDEVQTLSMGDAMVIQNYSGAISFSLVQTSGEGGFGPGEAPIGATSTPVTVRGQQGTLITGNGGDQGTLLRWRENGVTIMIAGTLSADEAQDVAASLR